jgi:hypothetical protein
MEGSSPTRSVIIDDMVLFLFGSGILLSFMPTNLPNAISGSVELEAEFDFKASQALVKAFHGLFEPTFFPVFGPCFSFDKRKDLAREGAETK